MRTFTAVVERCPVTHLYVGYVPGFPGAHSQGATLDELNDNLNVIKLIKEHERMRANVIRIGNSQGIRLPKVILKQSRLGNEVDLPGSRR